MKTLTNESDLVKAFKELPRSARTPSGMVANVWHFDLRYIHLSPPSHVLFLFQPGSSFVHQELLPYDNKTGESGVLYFPENAKEAAPEIAKALLHAFVDGLGNKQMMGDRAPPPYAPWKLSTESEDIAKMVGEEFERLGVVQELCTIGITSASTIESAQEAFTRLFIALTNSMGIVATNVPLSIQYRATNVPSGYDEHHRSELAYSVSMQRITPPTPESLSGNVPMGQETLQRLDITNKLLDARPAALIKAEADAGNPLAALDYGVRLYHGLRCPLDRAGSRAYLIQVVTSASATPETQAMAHAMLVLWYTQHFHAGPNSASKPIVMRYLLAGAYHANESARIIRPVLPKGSAVAPAVLLTTQMLENFRGQLPELGVLYADAFRAFEDRKKQMSKEGEKMTVKRMERPLNYRCANPVCPIEADASRVLRQCSGPCDKDKKPSYCSRECQRADWKNHKPFCKAGAPCSVIDRGFVSPAAGRAVPTGSISMPMGGINVSSSTMTPEFMKEVGQHVEELIRTGGQR